MADNVTNDELYRLMSAHGVVLTEIKNDVKAQNGKVATLETRVALLEERSGGGKQGALAGGAVTGVAVLIEVLRHYMQRP